MSLSSKPSTPSIGHRVTTDAVIQQFKAVSNSIAGTSTNLAHSLKEIEAELKKDLEGKKEYENYLKELEMKKKELQKRIDANKAWVAKQDRESDHTAFLAQYRKLLGDIEGIYSSAKGFHGQGVDMLIKQFNYHPAFKRHSDTFSATPFRPK